MNPARNGRLIEPIQPYNFAAGSPFDAAEVIINVIAIEMGRINTHSLVVVFLRAAAIAGIALKASRHVPRTLKWLFLFIITLNLRGFPLAWHGQYSPMVQCWCVDIPANYFTYYFISPVCAWRIILVLLPTLNIKPVRHLSPWINAALKDGLTAKIKGRKVWLERLTNISPIGAHPLDVVEILKLRAGTSPPTFGEVQ